MPHYTTVMNQLLQLLPRHEFERIVGEHQADRNVKKFSCYQQLVVMLLAQLRGLDSLREIETTLAAHQSRWYHLGLKTAKRSTVADANTTRPWRIYEALYYRLLERCQSFNPRHRFKIPNPIVSMDATIINLCLNVFPWANYQNTKGAVKLHCQLDYAGYLPTRIVVTTARRHEVRVVQEEEFPLQPDSIVLMDRGFTDYSWFQHITHHEAWFITRARKNMKFVVAGQQPVPRKPGLATDEIICLEGAQAREDYPGPLRLLTVLEPRTRKPIRILTNNFSLDAETIADLYRARWEIENFFKWIKQNLKIKSFLGTSKNAVLTQIWIAMCAYVLLCYLKFQSRSRHTLLELSRLIRETLLSPYSLVDLFRTTADQLPAARSSGTQLELFA